MSTEDHGPGAGDHGQPPWQAQPPPQQPWAQGAPAQPTNGKAIGGLVASILGFFCGIGFIVGLVLGYSARNEIRASAGQQAGEGMATAAIVIGWIGVGLTVLGVLIALLVLPFSLFAM